MAAKAKRKMAQVYIERDSLNKNDTEVVFELFDDVNHPEVVAVRRGEFVDVPLWVAERAKEIGLITTYKLLEAK